LNKKLQMTLIQFLLELGLNVDLVALQLKQTTVPVVSRQRQWRGFRRVCQFLPSCANVDSLGTKRSTRTSEMGMRR